MADPLPLYPAVVGVPVNNDASDSSTGLSTVVCNGVLVQPLLVNATALPVKEHMGVRWLICMNELIAKPLNTFPWVNLLSNLKLTPVGVCHFHVSDANQPVLGCFCVLKTYRSKDEIVSKLLAYGCSVVRKLSPDFVHSDALFQHMGETGALTFEMGFQHELGLYSLRVLQHATLVSPADMHSMIQGTMPCSKFLEENLSKKRLQQHDRP
jgi:hypothetical protein